MAFAMLCVCKIIPVRRNTQPRYSFFMNSQHQCRN